MARRAYKRVLKSGRVVNVRASFASSPNRVPGKLPKSKGSTIAAVISGKVVVIAQTRHIDADAKAKALANRSAWDEAAHENYGF